MENWVEWTSIEKILTSSAVWVSMFSVPLYTDKLVCEDGLRDAPHLLSIGKVPGTPIGWKFLNNPISMPQICKNEEDQFIARIQARKLN